MPVYSTPFTTGGFDTRFQVAAFSVQIPAPGSIALLAIGLLGTAGVIRRKKAV